MYSRSNPAREVLMHATNGIAYCLVIVHRSPNFCNLCVRLFDRQSTRTMKFDDFIQCCVMLKSLTDQFRQRDVEQRGIVRLSYEEVSKYIISCQDTLKHVRR